MQTPEYATLAPGPSPTAAAATPPAGPPPPPPRPFRHWKPGASDAVRAYFVSENFQGAVQLATGILFVSLFVFVK